LGWLIIRLMGSRRSSLEESDVSSEQYGKRYRSSVDNDVDER
jgi:hypothetical protein